MNYGYFDDSRREYVITNPQTPVKWINYIGSLAFGGFVDQTGGALICKGDPALNRITRYLALLPAGEMRGETLYLRLHQPGGYRVLSPFYVPGLEPLESYECRVGLGYTRLSTRLQGIECQVTIFVPPGQAVELRQVRVTNRGSQAVTLDAVPVVEYTHFDALKQLTNADWVPQTMTSRAATLAGGRLALLQYAFMKRDTAINYFTASRPASSFETDRKRFLGANEYGTWAAPLALQQPELSNYEARRGDTIAALLLPLGTLQPGEICEFTTQLGQEASLQDALPQIEAFNQPAAVEQALAELARFWDSYLEKQHFTTPDPALNSMLNVHNPRQCHTTLNWSRYLSLYQLGYGARGIGFRDSSQDIMGVLASAPAEAKALLRKLLAVQRPDGSAYHQFNPLSMIAEVGDAAESEDRPHYYGDDALWGVLVACLYGKALLELAELCEFLGKTGQAAEYRAWHAEMGQRVEQHAWDGEWYVSYFDSRGEPLGSHHNQAGQIYTYTQAWAVIAGFASPERGTQALDSVQRLLNTRCGIKLSTPGFNGFDPSKGGITTYPPGAKENGGIFLHVNPWVVIAEVLLGNPARAYQYYTQINPALKNERIEEYECEPYVYAQNILGDEHPQFGLGRNSWLSGTASWMYQAGTQYLLGLRPTYAGLRIEPCIPPEWAGFRAVRIFRGARYEIEVRRAAPAGLEVDGQAMTGKIVPIFSGGTHQVVVRLGA